MTDDRLRRCSSFPILSFVICHLSSKRASGEFRRVRIRAPRQTHHSMLVAYGGGEGADRFVVADHRAFDSASNHVSDLNGLNKFPFASKEYRAGAREIFGHDRVQNS